MEPTLSRSSGKLRLRYDLPHRVFASKVYPLQAPNGSQIIVYGHEQGLRILWRGGRRFKYNDGEKDGPKLNGSSKEDAMVLDSDEEIEKDDAPTISDFEVDEEEIDWNKGYEEILRYLDVDFGTAARHIATPHVSVIAKESPGAFPPLLTSHIVVAAACSDCSIRLVTLPLLPPRGEVDDKSFSCLHTVRIYGPNMHQQPPSSISITHSVGLESTGSERGQSRSPSTSRNRLGDDKVKSVGSRQSDTPWCFLIASVSATAGGLLLTHSLPISSESKVSPSRDDMQPLERCYLGFPCSTSQVLFNTSAYPARRHSTLLIRGATADCVKLYQVPDGGLSVLSGGRRGSTATLDSVASNTRSLRGDSSVRGRFLLTLHAGFISSPDSSVVSRRKKILDMTWVASGQAIFALLEDGHWGVWDLEGAGPTSGTKDLLKNQISASGIQGGALMKFALGGRFNSTSSDVVKHGSNTSAVKATNTLFQGLAPMTPQTRKIKSQGLFHGRHPVSAPKVAHLENPTGRVCVTEHLSSIPPSTVEEALVLTYDSEVVHISSLQALWRAQTRKKGTLDSLQSANPTALQINLGPFRLIDVAPLAARRKPEGDGKTQVDILMTLDQRLIFSVAPLSDSPPELMMQPSLALRPTGILKPISKPNISHPAPKPGQLDLESMDQILDGMQQRDAVPNGRGDLDDTGELTLSDDDLGMSLNSPTPKPGRGRAPARRGRK